jgi:glucokinase
MTHTAGPVTIGIDLGATKIAGGLVDEHGALLAEAHALTRAAEGAPAVIARIAQVVQQLMGRAHAPVTGVGIGTPGLVDGAAGIVRNAVNLNWHGEVPLAHAVAATVAERTGLRLPVYVENDANAQAVGEVVFGAGKGLDSLVLLTIGSGLGGGVIANGRLVAGATYTAAELGHLVIDPDGRRCACGLHGCVETVVSGPGLVKTVRELLDTGHGDSVLRGNVELTAADVLAAARSGDAPALAALDVTARWLGITLASAVAVVNPAAIVIGGGLGLAAFDLLIPGAQRELARRVIPQSLDKLQIVPAQVTSSAVGGAALVHLGTRRTA